MFSFVIYDKFNKLFYLARDRSGEKPLYYGLDENQLFFSSQLKSIKEIPNIKFKLNKEALNYFFNYCYVPAPLSIYENINKLEPGKLLIIKFENKNSFKIKDRELYTYWSQIKCFSMKEKLYLIQQI